MNNLEGVEVENAGGDLFQHIWRIKPVERYQRGMTAWFLDDILQ